MKKNNRKAKMEKDFNIKKSKKAFMKPKRRGQAKTEKITRVRRNKSHSIDKVRIIPLGGLGEIGKNMTAVEIGKDIFVIDAGLTFPDETMLGIDIVIPDMTYLEENKDRVKALLVTHGHEDHIGAVPYLLKKINTKVYSTKLTLGLIEVKLKEHNLDTSVLRTVHPGQTIKLGSTDIEFVKVSHSIPDATSIVLHSPIGKIIFTGDFKVDYTPIDGVHMDLQRFGQLGKEGVLLLLADSTNVERPGYTMSELSVRETFKQIFIEAQERIIIATFASNLHRIQQVIDATEFYNRKLFISGRSMEKNVKIAIDLGYLRIKKDTLRHINEVDKYDADQVVLLTTGSQGEPLSALTRLSKSEHRKVKLMPGDTVVISATPIPGNEGAMGDVINNLTDIGCNVIYSKLADVHVSGHAAREELKLMLSLVRPKFFIPVHGESRHLKMHKELAISIGIEEDNILVGKNGDVFELKKDSLKIINSVQSGPVLVDGLGVGDVGNIVLRDRKHLSEEGLIAVSVSFDKKTNKLVGSPEIVTRGFVYVKGSTELFDEIYKIVQKIMLDLNKSNKRIDITTIKNTIKDRIKSYVFSELKRDPMILPMVMAVENE